MNPAVFDEVSRRRRWADRLGRWTAQSCGIGVITALALMFVYLLYEVWPLAVSPELEDFASWDATETQGGSQSPAGQALISLRGGKVLSFGAWGARLYAMNEGQWQPAPQLPQLRQLAKAEPLTVVAAQSGSSQLLVLGASGEALVLQPKFELHWEEGETDFRKGEPRPVLELPFGDDFLQTGWRSRQDRLAFFSTERQLLLASASGRQLSLLRWPVREAVFGDGYSTGRPLTAAQTLPFAPQQLLIGRGGQLYALSAAGEMARYALSGGQLVLQERRELLQSAAQLGHAAFVLGGETLVVGDSEGQLAAWRQVSASEGSEEASGDISGDASTDAGPKMTRIRQYQPLARGEAVALVAPESGRKGFAVFGSEGGQSIYYLGEKQAVVRRQDTAFGPPERAWFDSTSRLLVGTDGGRWKSWRGDNEHPETSTHLLWGKVWYEGYEQPQYLWQSSSADLNFEPKFSLIPLLLGTLKGALYAMLFAAPIALMAAIYIARFMAPAARSYVKPAIEIMAAVPTVILGFIGALWLAPIAANNLIGILLIFPLMLLSFAAMPLLLRLLPAGRWRPRDGWEFVVAMLLCLPLGWLWLSVSPLLEVSLFSGDIRFWLDEFVGVVYEERNAFIVGLVMGFAVIPTIFSIAEDALFQAPKSLMDGGLALGANPWQCVRHIIVPTASPALFSALMIGFGRAVGETMVVVMCTGNTPITDWDIFSGMRTLSANIAVEMPEAELGSSHFRLLFLSALVLFCLTFFFNTLAEVIRGWLRKRYATL